LQLKIRREITALIFLLRIWGNFTMIKQKKSMIVGLAISTSMLVMAPSAFAAPNIDFTDDDPWIGVEGETTFSNGSGVTITGLPTPGMTFNARNSSSDPNLLREPCTLGYACDGDGIGIGDDEISWSNSGGFSELLTVEFDTAQTITEISFLDLFDEGTGRESAYWRFNAGSEVGNALQTLEAPLANLSWPATNGFAATSGLSVGGVTSITFLVSCPQGNCAANDYSLAGINAVPIPAAAWLFGSALIGLVGVKRRQRS
jgi:hypothetical protein